MIPRRLTQTVIDRLEQFPAVALLGPRQVGKTTLAEHIAQDRKSIYLDLELPEDQEKLSDAQLYLSSHEDKLVIIDEVQRAPGLFQVLRGLIDQGKRKGYDTGRFLLLGSASIDLLKQSSETLAGRIAYLELNPFNVLEIKPEQQESLWLHGGFPKSFLASSDGKSAIWRDNFIRSYLERDIPQLGPRIPAETLRRFWTMLAHAQGGLHNAALFAQGLAVDGKTIVRYLGLMVDLLLVRKLPPYSTNIGKRLVKSPKIYVCDSGVVHSLLQLDNREALLGHPIVGPSWEGFVIENLLRIVSPCVHASFYRTAGGAEIDLLFQMPNNKGLWAIEIKRGLVPRPEKGFYQACKDIQPQKAFVIYAGQERYPIRDTIEAISLHEMCTLLSTLEN